jgi:hypothetical protein
MPGCLWPHSNETFVPAAELLISVYVGPGVFLASETGRGKFHKQSIFGPGEPQCANACGFFNTKLSAADGGLVVASALRTKQIDHMVRIGSRKWTPAQITHLIELIDDGSSATVAAVSLKRSITVIRAKARSLGKPFPIVASQNLPPLRRCQTGNEPPKENGPSAGRTETVLGGYAPGAAQHNSLKRKSEDRSRADVLLGTRQPAANSDPDAVGLFD